MFAFNVLNCHEKYDITMQKHSDRSFLSYCDVRIIQEKKIKGGLLIGWRKSGDQ